MFEPISIGLEENDFTLAPQNLTWTSLNHLLTIGQPIGMGFSNALVGDVIKTTDQITKQFQAFITLFYKIFSIFVHLIHALTRRHCT